MPTTILSIPFVVIALACLYVAWQGQPLAAIGIIPAVVALAAIYVLGPQVNWWWYSRRPPRLPDEVVKLLIQHHAFFQALDNPDKRRFLDRVALFMLGNSFMAKGMEDEEVPEDLKAVVAASAVTLTFAQEEFLFPEYETVIVYPQAFLSPQYPDRFHASESFAEDGVLLFSAEHLLRSFVQPNEYFPVALYEYAHLYIMAHPDAGWPTLPDGVWEAFAQVGPFAQPYLHQYFNREDLDPQAVAVVHFFLFPDAFAAQLPDLQRCYADIFWGA